MHICMQPTSMVYIYICIQRETQARVHEHPCVYSVSGLEFEAYAFLTASINHLSGRPILEAVAGRASKTVKRVYGLKSVSCLGFVHYTSLKASINHQR